MPERKQERSAELSRPLIAAAAFCDLSGLGSPASNKCLLCGLSTILGTRIEYMMGSKEFASLTLGIVLGVAIGMALGNVGIGIGIGIALGIAFGLASRGSGPKD